MRTCRSAVMAIRQPSLVQAALSAARSTQHAPPVSDPATYLPELGPCGRAQPELLHRLRGSTRSSGRSSASCRRTRGPATSCISPRCSASCAAPRAPRRSRHSARPAANTRTVSTPFRLQPDHDRSQRQRLYRCSPQPFPPDEVARLGGASLALVRGDDRRDTGLSCSDAKPGHRFLRHRRTATISERWAFALTTLPATPGYVTASSIVHATETYVRSTGIFGFP